SEGDEGDEGDDDEQVHITIRRSDGVVVYDGDEATAEDVTLTATDSANRFLVTAFTDRNGDGVIDKQSEDDSKRQVSVTVIDTTVDLNIDSDNNNGSDLPDHSDWEETLEDNPYGLGKFVPENDNYVPVVFYLQTELDPDDPNIRVRFDFSTS